MKIPFLKLHPDAVTPARANATDAGFDLVATEKKYEQPGNCWRYGTGIAVEIPKGHCGLVFQRSSIFKTSLMLSNCVSVIDSGYRGEILFRFRPVPGTGETYDCGDRIGQLLIVPLPAVEFMEVTELLPSDRGEGGFGSTGR